MFGMIKSVWDYRNFVISSVRNEFLTQFSRSGLGGLWMILNPLSQVAIYALILSNVLAAKLPGIDNKFSYALYLMAGILAWNLHAEIINRSLDLFISKGSLIKKVNFPKITLPVITIGSSLVNNLLLLATILIAYIVLGQAITMNALWIVPLTILVVLFSTSLGLIFGVLNVFIRDVNQAIPIILQVWFWFTPIVYPAHIIPETLQSLMNFNPLFHIVTAYHDVLLYGAVPNLKAILTIFMISILTMGLSLFMFRKASAEMVDVL